MDDARTQRLEESFAALAPRGEELVERFYHRLFETHPDVRTLFPEDMTQQRGKLLSTLVLVVNSIRNLDGLVPVLHNLGARHLELGTLPEHYGAVRDGLVDTMAEMAGALWSDTLDQDWRTTIDLLSSIMLEGANQTRPA